MRFAGPYFNGFPFDACGDTGFLAGESYQFEIPILEPSMSANTLPDRRDGVPIVKICDLNYLQAHWLWWRVRQLDLVVTSEWEIDQHGVGDGAPSFLYEPMIPTALPPHAYLGRTSSLPVTEMELLNTPTFNFGFTRSLQLGDPVGMPDFSFRNGVYVAGWLWFAVAQKDGAHISRGFGEPNFELLASSYWSMAGWAGNPIEWECPDDFDWEEDTPGPEHGCTVFHEGVDFTGQAVGVDPSEEEAPENCSPVVVDIGCPYGDIQGTIRIDMDGYWNSTGPSPNASTIITDGAYTVGPAVVDPFWSHQGTYHTGTGDRLKDPYTGLLME